MKALREKYSKLLGEKAELEKELHKLLCRYGDLADLVVEVACDYERGKELVFLPELVKKIREQQNES